jgi:uncharacterized protein (DUF2267 family)
MPKAKRVVQSAGLVAGAVAMIATTEPGREALHRLRVARDRLRREGRYGVARMRGTLRRLAGTTPDPNVSDDVLADRVRSTIGPVEKHLDIPHIHVMVEDHIAILHGDVTDANTAIRIEDAVMNVSGVQGVESHLHHGLIPGDTRPSQGAAIPSTAMGTLLEAARKAGATDARAAVHAVLCGFSERLPADERAHVFAHLPSDVRALIGPIPRRGARARLRTIPQLVGAVIASGEFGPEPAERIARAVVGALHDLVPEEARDVAAVLPADLRELWESTPAT